MLRMSAVEDDVREAYEKAGYDVAELTVNRRKVRLGVAEDDASASELREVLYDIIDEDEVLGFDVTTESVEDADAVMTVVSFRHRS